VKNLVELDAIYEPIQKELQELEQKLKAAIDVDVPILSLLLDYVLESSGKRIRPAITLFAGKLNHYDLDLLLPAASAIEFLHSGSLVHDDVVDNSTKRRGKLTVNSLWGDTNAVLLGDYLFGKAASLVIAIGSVRVTELFSRAVMNIIAGELRHKAAISNQQSAIKEARHNYYRWIGAKTACLFSVAAESGAILGQAPEEAIRALEDYGYNFGMAFQVVDDILDFIGDEAELGKPLGSDLSQGILTLPTILFLERYPEDGVVKEAMGSNDTVNVKLAVERVSQSVIIRGCFDIASDFCHRACQSLKNLPDYPSRSHLIDLAHYAVQRKK